MILVRGVHKTENKKWWYDQNGVRIDSPNHRLIMLIESEIFEAFEGFRKNLQDDKLAHRKMADVELADAVIRLLDRVEGKKLVKFRGICTYHGTNVYNGDFVKALYEIVWMLHDNQINTITEVLVKKILDIGHEFGYDIFWCYRRKASV